MHSRIEKIKNHIVNNKATYITGGVCFVVGAAGAVIATRKVDTLVNVNPKIQQVLSWKPQATLEVYIEALGDPGDIIQDTATGTIYASQGQAARALGLHQADISRHLAGKTDSVKGHVFEKLGKAQVSE